MKALSKGQKCRLDEIGCGDAQAFAVTLTMPAPGLTIDVAGFGLDAAGRLSDDRYMVFFNQKSAPDNAIELATTSTTSTFTMALARLPAAIERVVFAASIDGAGTMKQLGACSMTVGEGAFAFTGADFDTEKAVIVGELYRRDGAWRFGAVGQGFAGGLSALLAHFGGSEQAPDATPAPVSAPAPAPARISLSKVTLTKPNEKHAISLVKGPAAPKKLIVKATWQDNGDSSDDNDDLDLRVGILLPDGRMALVTAPDRPGSLNSAPYVRHMGDVTSASAKEPATETVEVNVDIAAHSGGKVALVFSVYSAVSNGAVAVASLKPKMRMEYGEQVVECAFDFSTHKSAKNDAVYTYVIGTAIIDGDTVVLSPSGETSKAGSENTPWLTWSKAGADLSMDGPIVFKGHGNKQLPAGARKYI